MSQRSGPVEERAVVASRLAVGWPRANPDEQDQSQLVAARLPTDNAGLVHFLGLRARGEPAQGTLDQLIENFGRVYTRGPVPGLCATSSPLEHRPYRDCEPWYAKAASPLTWPGIALLPSNPTGEP